MWSLQVERNPLGEFSTRNPLLRDHGLDGPEKHEGEGEGESACKAVGMLWQGFWAAGKGNVGALAFEQGGGVQVQLHPDGLPHRILETFHHPAGGPKLAGYGRPWVVLKCDVIGEDPGMAWGHERQQQGL